VVAVVYVEVGSVAKIVIVEKDFTEVACEVRVRLREKLRE